MYLRLLSEAVSEKRGEAPIRKTEECLVDIQIDAHIPEKYISNLSQRIDVYKKIACVRTETDCMEMLDELIDREILSYNQHDNLLLKEIEEEITSFVGTLPEQRKRVFLLSREENLKNKEIALRLNISEKAVEKHITKALSDIRTHLTETGLMSGLICFLLNQN